MDTILVIGAETVVGANMAVTLSHQHRVVGLTATPALSLGGCEIRIWDGNDSGSLGGHLAAVSPDRVIICGAAARSCWDPQAEAGINADEVQRVARIAEAVAAAGARLTFISSDAVFSGPWMFHAEQSTSLCPSRQAELVRNMESAVVEHCPQALIVRTNAFGWSPRTAGPGWIENLLDGLQQQKAGPFDPLRHATPILATDLAQLVDRAHQEELTGPCHLAGSERINPVQFAELLAETFGRPYPRRGSSVSLSRPASGFGAGETSLQTRHARSELSAVMPMLAEGLHRLFEQQHDGHCDLLHAETAREMVA